MLQEIINSLGIFYTILAVASAVILLAYLVYGAMWLVETYQKNYGTGRSIHRRSVQNVWGEWGGRNIRTRYGR